MKTTCCGEERDTPFCPLCGKKLKEASPLVELLSHVDKMSKRTAAILKNHPNISPDGKAGREAEKWRSWANALRELIQSKEG